VDEGGGPRDQWMNTDAYVAPDVGSFAQDGGALCGDAVSFGSALKVSPDEGSDGGIHVHFGVSVAGGADGGTYLGWMDRDITNASVGDVRVAAVSGSQVTGKALERPEGCDLMLDPVVAVAAGGKALLAVACATGSEKEASRTQILLYTSDDGFAKVEGPSRLKDCYAVTERCLDPWVTVSQDGKVYVGWTKHAIESGVEVGMAAVVARSDDGTTIAEEFGIEGPFVATKAPRVAVDQGGTVHTAYVGWLDKEGASYVAHATLGTAGFGTPDILGQGTAPSLALGDGGVVVVWTFEDNVYVAENAGAGFGAAVGVPLPSGTTAAYAPTVAIGHEGSVHLAWFAGDGSSWAIYYAVSEEVGGAFGEPLRVSGPFDADPTGETSPVHRIGRGGVWADVFGVRLVWGESGSTDPSHGTAGIYMARRVCP